MIMKTLNNTSSIIRTLTLVLFVSVIFTACKENVDIAAIKIVDNYSLNNLFAFKDAKYLLGKTRKQYIPEDLVKGFSDRGLKVKFNNKNVLQWVEIVSPNFSINKRIKVGDKRDKLIGYLGEPNSEKDHVGKQNEKLGTIKALYYDNLVFYTRDDVVSIIIFGKTLHSKAPAK